MGLGFHFPFQTIDRNAHGELARELLDRGYEHVWTGENPGVNGFLPLVDAAHWAPGIGLGCACFPVQTRGPGLFADTIAQLCALAPPGKVAIGIGSSSQFVVERSNGRPFGKPLAAVRDMARFLKQALGGEAVKADFETFRVRYKLPRPIETPPEVLVAALRPKMIELAAAESDGVILNNIGPEDLPKIVPLVRKYGPDKRIAARVYITPVESKNREFQQVAAASIAAYFPLPTYRKHQEWLGHSELYQPLWDANAAGGYYAAREAVTEEMVARTYLSGSVDECRAKLQAFQDAGVDTVIVSPVEEALDPRETARLLAPA